MPGDLSWEALDHHLLELVAGLNSVGEQPNGDKVLELDKTLDVREAREGLWRLREAGLLEGEPLLVLSESIPELGLLRVTSFGHAMLTDE